ncbi:hypothetical protein BH23VER1_BH23VER1_28570 [soil metagenome]
MIPPDDVQTAAQSRARAFAGIFCLPFHNRVWKGPVGDLVGGGAGSSLDFQDHRSYVPGDDPRHINWQAYARTGLVTMKLYREEVRPLVDLVLDVSPSMFLDASKAARSLELFYFAAESALRSTASLATYVVLGKSHTRLETGAVLGRSWPSLLGHLAGADPATPPDLAPVPFRPHALRTVVSDLLFPGAPEAVALPLAARNGRGLVLCPFARSESDPGWSGNYEFVDAERDARRHVQRVEPPLLNRYLAAYSRHFDLWRNVAAKHGIAFARVSADAPFDRALQSEAVPAGAIEFS